MTEKHTDHWMQMTWAHLGKFVFFTHAAINLKLFCFGVTFLTPVIAQVGISIFFFRIAPSWDKEKLYFILILFLLLKCGAACWICLNVYICISFPSTLSSSQGPIECSLHIHSPSLSLCLPLISVSLSHFSATPLLFFFLKRAYFLLLRKAELAQSQTSIVDEGKYIILTKERQADVFIRVWLEDVAPHCSQRGTNQSGKGHKSSGFKCKKKPQTHNRVNETDFLLVN